MRTKQPKVTLYNFTKNPIATMALPVSAWHAENIIDNIDNISPAEALRMTKAGLRAYHKTAIEYIDTVWVIRNVSRAFQQQLTRTRVAAFAIQSLRVVSKEGFATNGHYTMPDNITDEQKDNFHLTMLKLESMYEELLEEGFLVEDARSILPLNIHSDVTFKINLAGLYHMLEQRLCVNTQWEYRQVAVQIKEQVHAHLGDVFGKLIDAPCIRIKTCPMGKDYCGTKVWELTKDEQMTFYKDYKPDGEPHQLIIGDK